MSLLEVKGLDTAYGAIAVNRDVSLSVAEGEIATILGPNGAGKTTLLRAICGLMKPKRGRIVVDDRDMTGATPDVLAEAGIVMVPEGRRIFADLTVKENLRLGGYCRQDRDAIEADIGRMESTFPVLAEKARQKGGSLSGGQQQMLAIARGLMARPRILLLDEPSLGLAPVMVKQVQSVIAAVRSEFGATVLLVEQNAGLALSVAERAYLLQRGEIVVSGEIAALRDHQLMRELYLGKGDGRQTAPRSGSQAAGARLPETS
jgi:branched-chain amino acid transport system ATP-binding protein